MTTYRIPAENRAALVDRLVKLNKKAEKLGTSPIRVEFSRESLETLKDGSVREWLNAEVEGDVATVAGYYFRAAIHHTSDGNILSAVAGYEVPREYRNAASSCDHCRTIRKRSATYLLESAAGVVQVGRSCLKDFTGFHNPEAVARWAELLGAFDVACRGDEDEMRAHGSRVDPSFRLEEFLTYTATVIRLDGWVSRTVAMRSEHATATVSTVWRHFAGTFSPKELVAARARYIETEEDRATASAALAWVEALGEDPANDYLHNLSIIARSGLVNLRTSGLAASLISAYLRDTTKRVEREARPASLSRHQGTPGQRLRNIPVTVLAVIDLEPGDFGPRQIVKMADADGNVYVWFTGALPGFQPGSLATLTGTVKRHTSHGADDQTELSRCVLVERDAEVAA